MAHKIEQNALGMFNNCKLFKSNHCIKCIKAELESINKCFVYKFIDLCIKTGSCNFIITVSKLMKTNKSSETKSVSE